MEDTWFEENLRLTYDFFAKNVCDDLFLKVSETYDKYPRLEQGGPLFFILMLNQLLADTEEAASSLQKRVKEFKISNVEGEDIRKVVSLLRGAVNRLTYIKKVPEDITKIMLQVMQASSVESFNETFHILEKQRKLYSVLCKTGRNDADITVDKIFTLAEAEYRDLHLDCKWTGIHTTGGESVFNAGHNRAWTPTCFNCGGPHTDKECPKPQDQARIKIALKKFHEDKAAQFKERMGGGANKDRDRSKPKSGSGLWGKPKPHENNRRVIKGRPHTYNPKSKRWGPDKSAAPAPTPAAPAANAVVVIPPLPPPAAASPGAKNQMIQLAVSTSARAVNSAFENLALQFMEE
jgi:hypothetical protein